MTVETDDRAPTQHLGDTLSALIDGELTDDAAASARAHLAGCRACEAEMAAVDQVRSWLRDLPPVEPPADFYRRIRSSEPEEAPTPATPTLLTAMPATAMPATAMASTTATVRPRRRAGVVALVGCAAATAV
ncbi:MAG: zf-HC2 domain-containing protein, partial [Acidimicrobiia bacterium]|nr:zf-HC2 domain-containing protein [Acidimicrobiia bacterium]